MDEDRPASRPALAGLNTIDIAGTSFLLAEGVYADHLVGEAREGPARPAFDADFFGPAAVGSTYDVAELSARRWAQRTLCGYEWAVMAAGDAGPLLPGQAIVTAPSCKTCLRLVTRTFPKAAPDPRVGRLARLVSHKVAERGYAEVVDTPGEQLDALRAAIRADMRRLGHRVRTLVMADRLCVMSDDVWAALSEAEQLARMSDGLQAVGTADAGRASEPPWRFSWRDWESWSG